MGEQEMTEVDRVTARASVEVGYMPLSDYIERFADAARHRPERVSSPATAPDMREASEPVLQAYAFTLMEPRQVPGGAKCKRVRRAPSTA
jgi:hypothetical protein